MPTRPQLKSNKKLITRNNKQKRSGFWFQAFGSEVFDDELRRIAQARRVSVFRFASGQILILALFFLTIILILSASLFGKIANYVRFGKVNADTQAATFLAEAGVDYAMFVYNNDDDPDGTTITLGSGEVTITADSGPSPRSITSTGCIPNCTNAKTKRKIKISTVAGSNTFPITGAAFVGNGSLVMGQTPPDVYGPTINGDVFTNGPITINQGTINGNLKTASNMGFWKSSICSHVVPSPPWTCKDASDGITSQLMPTPPDGFTEAIVKDAASPPVGTQITGDYIRQCTATREPYYLGNVKITGKLEIDGCDLILQGPIWVVGEVKIHGSANVRLDSTLPIFADKGTAIISDSKISVFGTYTSIEKLPAPPKDRYIILWSTVTSTVNNAMEGGNPSGGFYGADGGFWYAPGAPNGTGGKVLFQGHTNIVSVAAQQLTLVGDTTLLNYEIGLGEGEYWTGTGYSSSWVLQKGTYQYVNP